MELFQPNRSDASAFELLHTVRTTKSAPPVIRGSKKAVFHKVTGLRGLEDLELHDLPV